MTVRAVRRESLALHISAGALLVGGPIWHHLYTSGYPLRVELVVLPLAAAAGGALVGAVAFVAGRHAGSIVFGALLLVFLDLQFDIAAWPIRTIVLAALCIALTLLLAAHRALIACATVASFHIAALPLGARDSLGFTSAHPESNRATTTASPPFLVHIVLDEQWGTGGLRAAGDTVTAALLTEFYLSRGFELFDAAYSRRANTEGSLPELMSLGAEPALEQLGPTRFRLRSNPYFDWLGMQGYRLTVFESWYLDYCRAATPVIASCVAVPAVSVANIGHLQGSWRTRWVLAARFLLNLRSYLYVRVHGADGLGARRSSAGRGAAVLRDVQEAVAGARGRAVFAHVLLPHRPLELDAQCNAWPASVERVDYEPVHDMPEREWRRRLHLYGAQVRCAHRVIADIIAAVDSAYGAGRSIIIIHGDHGSRLSRDELVGRSASALDAGELNALYSTLLAVRTPWRAAAVHSAPVPLQDFFRQLVEAGFRTPLEETAWDHYVFYPAGPMAEPGDTINVLVDDEMPWSVCRVPDC